MSHKQQAEYHLTAARVLQERLDNIESLATAKVMGEDAWVAGTLADDPHDLAAKEVLTYQVGLKVQKYNKIMGSMAGSRDRHLQWAQAHALLALVEVTSDAEETAPARH